MAVVFGAMWYMMSVRAQGGMGPDRMEIRLRTNQNAERSG